MYLFFCPRPFRVALLAKLYPWMTFTGLTIGHYGIGIMHFHKRRARLRGGTHGE